MRRRVAAAIGAAALAIGSAGAWMLWPRDATEISEADAITEFREHGTATAASDHGTTGAVPQPGVYTFHAAGQEVVKLGPLPAETRTLPETVTAVIVDRGDGCFDLTVNLFAEHTEDTRYCTADNTLSIDSHAKHQQIGAVSPTATMTCDPATMMSPPERQHPLACTLDLAGGQATISARIEGTASRGPMQEYMIDGQTVDVTPLRISYDVTGDLSGTWNETLWLTDTNLPVRIERVLDLSGPASFAERSEFHLASLTPKT